MAEHCSHLKYKVRYENKAVADNFLEHFRKTNPEGRKKPVRSFYCSHCKGYHLTSQVKDYKSSDGGVSRRVTVDVRKLKDWITSLFDEAYVS